MYMSISVSMSVQLIARQHVLITLLNGVDATSGSQAVPVAAATGGKWQVQCMDRLSNGNAYEIVIMRMSCTPIMELEKTTTSIAKILYL